MAKKISKKPFKSVSAEAFNTSGGTYRFPFEVLDKTPGGSNLGRIEWGIEPVWSKRKREGRHYIEKLYVWARQTRDPRYSKFVFEIPCYAEALTGTSIEKGHFLHHVWYYGFCPEHKSAYMMAYPADQHTALEIRTFSSISLEAQFV